MQEKILPISLLEPEHNSQVVQLTRAMMEHDTAIMNQAGKAIVLNNATLHLFNIKDTSFM